MKKLPEMGFRLLREYENIYKFYAIWIKQKFNR